MNILKDTRQEKIAHALLKRSTEQCMKSLFKYLKPYMKECIAGPLFKFTEACFELIVPLVTAAIIDKGIPAA